MTTETQPQANSRRVLEWDGLLNVRDLGGLTTRDGRTVRWGALVRSDLLCRLTGAGRQQPAEHGIRTIVDVRFPDEVASDWAMYPFADWKTDPPGDGPRYLNLPLNAQPTAFLPAARDLYAAARSRVEINRLDIDHNQPGIAAIVGAIADAGPGGVLVHCHGGKDRTGMVVALILSALGVPDEQVADDYALSMANLEPLLAEWLDMMSNDPVERDRLRLLATPSREAMLETLAHVTSVHGSAEAYLRGGGLTDDQMARLRQRLLDQA